MFLFFSYIVLAPVSLTIGQAFACVDVDPEDIRVDRLNNDRYYLAADLSISCSTDRYQFGSLWAGLMILVYPIGIPLLYYWLLSANRNYIRYVEDDGTVRPTRPSDKEIERLKAKYPEDYPDNIINHNHLKFLYRAYEPQYWYWEVIETFRRLCFTAFVVMASSTPGLQVCSGM